MLTDFSFTPPGQILMDLKGGMQIARPGADELAREKNGDGRLPRKCPESMGDSMPAEVFAQKWDDQKQSFVRTALRAPRGGS